MNDLVKTRPSYITIENLNIRGMMKNNHLSKAITGQKFFEFRTKLGNKRREKGIELRVVDRFYPSSKLCHACGYIVDRDYNASLNLRDAKIYNAA